MNENDKKNINQIVEYVKGFNLPLNRWYCGITNEPKRRVFQEHKVDENGVWVIADFSSYRLADEIEEFFIKNDCKGRCGGGNKRESKFVYLYLITNTTVEDTRTYK